MTRVPLIALVAAVALAAPGCDLSSSDRAGGGEPEARATTLTMANVNYAPEELAPFASAVESVSGGRLRIRFVNEWGRAQDRLSVDERIAVGDPGYGEANLIRDVQAGEADLGWTGSRAFDVVGDPDFRPLHAPMLIESYALELEVLNGDIVEPMLESLEELGLRGVGVLPGPLRRPLATHPLRAPGDWSDMNMGFSGGEQIARSVRALGARPRLVPSGGSITGLDGIEQHVAAIARNGYLRRAAREAVPAVLDAVRRDERASGRGVPAGNADCDGAGGSGLGAAAGIRAYLCRPRARPVRPPRDRRDRARGP